jgi:hypothetical protein
VAGDDTKSGLSEAEARAINRFDDDTERYGRRDFGIRRPGWQGERWRERVRWHDFATGEHEQWQRGFEQFDVRVRASN